MTAIDYSGSDQLELVDLCSPNFSTYQDVESNPILSLMAIMTDKIISKAFFGYDIKEMTCDLIYLEWLAEIFDDYTYYSNYSITQLNTFIGVLNLLAGKYIKSRYQLNTQALLALEDGGLILLEDGGGIII